MKYNIYNETIPSEDRKEINEKILFLIEQNLCEENEITPEIVFNSYTGDGHLHGLDFKNFDSFYQYTKAKQEIEHGEFYTPHKLSQFLVECIKPKNNHIVMDITSGMGNFFNYCPIEQNCYSNELDIKSYKVQKYLYPNINLSNDDVIYYDPKVKADIIFSNPPYNLRFKVKNDEYLSQLYCCIKSSELLKAGGLMVLIVPNSFLNDEFSDGSMIKAINKHFNFLLSFDLPKNAFESVGVSSSFKTKVVIFQKQSEHIENIPYKNIKMPMPEINEQYSNYIYNTYVKKVIEQSEGLKAKLFFEELHNSDSEENNDFSYKVKKYLFDVKRNPKLIKYIGKCEEYINRYYTQKKPDGMEVQEWEKVKITKNKVLSYLKRTLAKQNKNEIDKTEIVKTSFGLKLKGYSKKNRTYLSKLTGITEMSFNDMILNNEYPFDDKKYYNLYLEKLNKYNKQSQSFKDMNEDGGIKNFLDDLVIHDTLNEKDILLNDIQKEDTNKALQKNYSFLQWERGCGKTITGTAQALYRLKNNDINNVIVISPSIAIKGTWLECMDSYGYENILINKISDLKKVKKGQIVLMTLYVVNKYSKQIKKFLKINNRKCMLIFDESDAITNINSQAYKSVLNCFRRLVKYKLLLTGTSTRNNINEFFSQLELLYNNSINMLSTADTIFNEDRKTKDLVSMYNINLNKPIPPYKKGYNLFKSMFSPSKASVFGISKNNQDIYNSAELKKLLSFTVITRTFKDVTGREGYKIHQKLCRFNKFEIDVYDKIINEFYELERKYFASTGNSRKDAMFRALHQLNLLLQACARFHTFNEYKGNDVSTKFKNIIKHVEQLEGQSIAIGVVTKKSVWEYQRQLQKHFPDRKIIAFTGEDLNIYQRKAKIKEIKEIKDVILITTQQSLSCSVNIGFIKNIIIPELQFNDARMGQYYFRFIRYDSMEDKDVFIYTYQNSIENNLMRLIMVKERINLFMKNQELNEEELNSKYGVDFDIFDMLLGKEEDSEGNLKITWGEQKII